MQWYDAISDWAEANATLLWWLAAGSIAAFALTPIAIGWTLVQLPHNYFVKEERAPLESWKDRPALRLVLLAIKNLVGVVLLVAGLWMLVIPGQGLLTIAVGLTLTDFPGKFRLQRWIVKRPSVWRSINWLRKRAHREPFVRPEA
jgi:hypothetical protein